MEKVNNGSMMVNKQLMVGLRREKTYHWVFLVRWDLFVVPLRENYTVF